MRSIKALIKLALLGVILSQSSCSISKIAVGVMDGILANGMDVMFEEDDLRLAEQAIAGNLKLLEALVRSDPSNTDLLLMTSQGYGGYALAFVEEVDPERASKFYLRGKDFALKILQRKNKGIYAKFNAPLAEFERALQTAKKSDVPHLFWLGYNWGAYANLNRTSVEAIGDLPKVMALMNRVLTLDEGFYFGGAHLFLGSYYGSLPRMMGGNPDTAKKHFDRAMQLTDNKFLLTKVYYAQYYARTTLDEELFKSTLTDVLAAPIDILPEQKLLTMLSKRRAQTLLDQMEDLF